MKKRIHHLLIKTVVHLFRRSLTLLYNFAEEGSGVRPYFIQQLANDKKLILTGLKDKWEGYQINAANTHY